MEIRVSEMNEGFRIDTDEKAAWAMRKYRQLAQKAQRHEVLASSERSRIDDWLVRVNSTISGEMEFFANHLEAYAIGQRMAGQKSVELPDGCLKTRSHSAGVTVDKSTFVQWAVEAKREDLLRVTYSPNMDAIKSTTVVDHGNVIDVASGEILAGVEPTLEKINVSIVPDLDAIDLEGIDDESE